MELGVLVRMNRCGYSIPSAHPRMGGPWERRGRHKWKRILAKLKVEEGGKEFLMAMVIISGVEGGGLGKLVDGKRIGRSWRCWSVLFSAVLFAINLSSANLKGRGAFGSVVKARNKIDNRIYAVKKIKLRASQFQSDSRIFREVNALSRLNHRFIVRYYTTWVEVADDTGGVPSTAPSTSSADSSEQGRTEHPSSSENSETGDEGEGGTTTSVPLGESDTDPFRVDFDDDTDTGTGTDLEGGESHHSFPSIHFMRSGSASGTRGDGDGTSSSEGSLFDIVFEEDGAVGTTPAGKADDTKAIVMTPRLREQTATVESKAGTPTVSRILYIQMVRSCHILHKYHP